MNITPNEDKTPSFSIIMIGKYKINSEATNADTAKFHNSASMLDASSTPNAATMPFKKPISMPMINTATEITNPAPMMSVILEITFPKASPKLEGC
ncbi:MAG: hypothetical protein Alpg2KO_18210 [Alphaproteobacteria bacterium]